MTWTKEMYDVWKEQWEKEHPGKTPPDFELFLELVDVFGFTPQELMDD